MDFDEYQKKALKTVLPSGNNLSYVTLGLANEAGEVAGKVKKWIRDNDSDPKQLDKPAIADELGDVLWYMAMMAQLLGVDLSEIARNNLKKLADRQSRDVLTGSGDNR